MGHAMQPKIGPQNTPATWFSIGFATGAASPCSFCQNDREVHVSVHGGDFAVTGPEEELLWMEDRMKAKYVIKSEHFDPGAHQK